MDYWMLEDQIILGDTIAGLSCVHDRGNLHRLSYFVAVTSCVSLYLVFD